MSRIAARLWIGPHDGGLGAGVRQDGFGDGTPLGRVGVEQAFGHVAANHGSELPAEVCSVPQSEAHALAAERRMDMRRIPGKQHSAAAVGLGKPRVVRPSAGVFERLSHGRPRR